MKRFVIIGAVVAVLAVLLLLFTRRGGETVTSDSGIATSQTVAKVANANTSEPPAETNAPTYLGSDSASQAAEFAARIAARDERMRLSNEAGNPAVAFYGKVVDQDSNALQNVIVDLQVIEEYVDPYPQIKTKRTSLQRQTGTDGRFEVSGNGLRGKYVEVYTLAKEGYEQEFPGRLCGTFGSQSTSFDNPGVLKIWDTNMHEPLITGEKPFVVTPDGRHYAIDLVKGTITEGEDGDLVVWIKRPEGVRWGQRYDWSCELAVSSGGMLESESQVMFTAPEVGYTNVFTHQEQANPNRWSVATGDKRFYVKLRNGQMYGRIAFQIFADFHGKQPAMIRLSYAVNPSGSRLLR